MPTISAASTPSRSVMMNAWSMGENTYTKLKMNFNFNMDRIRFWEGHRQRVGVRIDVICIPRGKGALNGESTENRTNGAPPGASVQDLDLLQESLCLFQLREGLLLRNELPRVYTPTTAAQLHRMFEVQHL